MKNNEKKAPKSVLLLWYLVVILGAGALGYRIGVNDKKDAEASSNRYLVVVHSAQ